MPKQRNFAEEYRRRIARGVARNLTRSKARGHPRTGESYASSRSGKLKSAKPDAALRRALAAMRSGTSLGATAKAHKVSRERLSAYAKSRGGATYGKRRWSFRPNDRFRIPIIAKGHRNPVTIWVADEEAAKLAGEHYNEAGRAVEKPILFPAFKKRWDGVTISDVKGKEYAFATDPNDIYRVLHADEIDWSRIYQRLTN